MRSIVWTVIGLLLFLLIINLAPSNEMVFEGVVEEPQEVNLITEESVKEVVEEPKTVFDAITKPLKKAAEMISKPAIKEVEEVVEVQPQLPPAKDIDLQSVVGIYCDFKKGNQVAVSRGSGVIVSPDGYVLTNRHVVDLDFNQQKETGFQVKGCRVYFTDFTRTFPAAPQGQYQFFDIETTSINYDFLAEAVYVPSTADGLSSDEERGLDFALLKLKEWNKNKYSGGRVIPNLHYSPVLINNIPEGEKMVMPGFSYQQIGSRSFDTLRLLTLTGRITKIFSGDKKFIKKPIAFEIKFTHPYFYPGHSGSPIFWRGHVIGLVTRKGRSGSNQVFYSPHVAIDGIGALLKEKSLLHNIQELR